MKPEERLESSLREIGNLTTPLNEQGIVASTDPTATYLDNAEVLCSANPLPADAMEIFSNFFNPGPFMPHGHCYFWTKSLVALHAVSDAFIVLAYYSIPLALFYFVWKRKDMKFHWMFVCFAVFIMACGTTHLMEIWNIWHASYWLSGGIKALTAMASVPTAILLVKLVPQALALPSTSQLHHVNEALQSEIAERKRAETRLREVNLDLESRVQERTQELGRLNAELEERVETRTAELKLANQELESFSYSISHDLRAPLRAMGGFANILGNQLGDEIPPEAHRSLQRIRDNAARMGQLIDALLTFASLGRQSVEKRLIHPDEIARAVMEELNGELKDRRVEIEIAELPACQADRMLLHQVFTNLLSNALKYTRDRDPAVIKVGWCKEGDENVYFVQDNGAGFDMEYASKLFHVFQRLHSTEEFDGTGVGLAIVHRIVARHGGRIWAQAKVDYGATFYFTLGESRHA